MPGIGRLGAGEKNKNEAREVGHKTEIHAWQASMFASPKFDPDTKWSLNQLFVVLVAPAF